jgi:hypothetical protein
MVMEEQETTLRAESAKERKLRRTQRALTWGGVAASLVWLIVLAVLVCSRWSQFVSLELNALGDFLAGSVAPLAFFWLVLGYFQQGIELSLNTEALKLQQEELRRQVEETANLARNAERSAAANETLAELSRNAARRADEDALRDAQPVIRYTGRAGGPDGLRLKFLNEGAEVSEVRLLPDTEGDSISSEGSRTWLSGQARSFVCRFRHPIYKFSMTYKDGLGVTRRQRFSLSPEGELTTETDYSI